MADWDDVRRLVLALPGTAERAGRTVGWTVGDKLFVWERPLRPRDLQALGLAEQGGPVLGARVADEGVKHALVADEPAVYFTTPHFDGYPAVLVWLEALDEAGLQELVVEAWLCRAPRRLVRDFLGGT